MEIAKVKKVEISQHQKWKAMRTNPELTQKVKHMKDYTQNT